MDENAVTNRGRLFEVLSSPPASLDAVALKAPTRPPKRLVQLNQSFGLKSAK